MERLFGLNESDAALNNSFFFSQTSINVTDEASDLRLPNYLVVIATACSVLLMVLGIAGNVLVPVVIFRNNDMRTSTNYFLVNLSIADVCVLLLSLPAAIVELHTRPDVWHLGYTMCKVVPYVEYSVIHGSVLSLVVISWERYQVTCQPLMAGYRDTKSKIVYSIVFIWMIAFLSAGPVLWFQEYAMTAYHDGVQHPNCLTRVDTLWAQVFIVSTFVIFFFFPLALLVVLYSIIARQLLCDSSEAIIKKDMSVPRIQARRQVVLMLAAVVMFFFMCLLPMRVFILWLIFSPPEEINNLGLEPFFNILYFCRIMFYLNSSINPVLYNMISTKFRKSFIRLFTKRKVMKPRELSSFTSWSQCRTNHASRQFSNRCVRYASSGRRLQYYKIDLGKGNSFSSIGSAASRITRQTSLASSHMSNCYDY